ncbi:COX15/CtaA family protein [Nocardioides marmoribigeumensis]|uniref:Cytochrome c oxidase assembly protein subunit 15 n=1 Tax=Nocardioides marmoribigeumensis TaxID=433649 RepID=A0ABU2C1E8_9ACTN|nr:COX15/CtaA family protein [Nocardioides marmoribigeumensis]MDR7364487.1 cytochrome c oxidase assembly protein subunit 15 [Nocardioides marmoribigeumensis]
MGLTTSAPVEPDAGVAAWARLRLAAWASLVANIGIVVTGGVVRLTGSGLGCPTWPRCTDEAFTPHQALSYHSAIEFGNRTLTFVLAAVAVATFVVAYRVGRRGPLRLAVLLALGVPAQALLGGITVLVDLNPWVVAGHLLLSMAMISVAVLLLRRVYDEDRPRVRAVPPALARLAALTYAAGWAVLYVGTVVTGSGPHAGDASSPRNGLDPRGMSQLHADLVFLLVGLTVGLLLALLATRARPQAVRAAKALLAVELAQGLVGFVQYFTGLPVLVVAVHLLGSAVVAAAMTWALVETRAAEPSRHQPGQPLTS